MKLEYPLLVCKGTVTYVSWFVFLVDKGLEYFIEAQMCALGCLVHFWT